MPSCFIMTSTTLQRTRPNHCQFSVLEGGSRNLKATSRTKAEREGEGERVKKREGERHKQHVSWQVFAIHEPSGEVHLIDTWVPLRQVAQAVCRGESFATHAASNCNCHWPLNVSGMQKRARRGGCRARWRPEDGDTCAHFTFYGAQFTCSCCALGNKSNKSNKMAINRCPAT